MKNQDKLIQQESEFADRQEDIKIRKQEIKLQKESKRMGKLGKTFIAGAIFLCAAALFLHALPTPTPDPTPIVVTEEQLIDIQEIATEKFRYQAAQPFQESRTIFDYDIPFTEKSFVLIYSGEMKAYFNMEHAKIDAGEERVTVILPQIEVSHSIENTAMMERNNIFNPIKLEDKQILEDDLRYIEEQRAIEAGFLDDARNNAKKLISALITPLLNEDQELEIIQSDKAKKADDEYIKTVKKKSAEAEKRLKQQ